MHDASIVIQRIVRGSAERHLRTTQVDASIMIQRIVPRYFDMTDTEDDNVLVTVVGSG